MSEEVRVLTIPYPSDLLLSLKEDEETFNLVEQRR